MSTLPREREGDGRFALERFDHVCTCGHTLGKHTAARRKDATGKVGQPCLEDDCPCDVFAKARAT